MRADRYATILLLVGLTGCAGTLEVTQTYTPAAAASVQSDRLVAVAVVRGAERIALPAGAQVERGRVVLPRTYVHELAPGDGTLLPLRPGDGVEVRGRLAPDDAIPGGGRVESSRATGALVAGTILFAISYGPSLYAGVQSTNASDRALEIPVAGPWMDLAERPRCVPPPSQVPPPIDPCLLETVSRVALVASGSVQGLADVLGLVGLPTHSEIVEGGDRGVGARAKPHIVFLPAPGGVAAFGTF